MDGGLVVLQHITGLCGDEVKQWVSTVGAIDYYEIETGLETITCSNSKAKPVIVLYMQYTCNLVGHYNSSPS